MTTHPTLVAQILTGSYPATPYLLAPLAERIREIEGFDVNLTFSGQAQDDSSYSPGTYDFERAASKKSNVARWIEKRISPNYPSLEVTVISKQGRPLLKDELLSYAQEGAPPWPYLLEYSLESSLKTTDNVFR